MNATFTQASWARDLLHRMGFPIDRNNVASILAWEYAEGGHFDNGARFNPLNTTMDHAKYGTMPGSTAGVATYPDYETGMRETIATLKLSAYSGIRHDLATSASPSTTTAAIASSPWGTGTGAEGTIGRARSYVSANPSVTKPWDGKNGGNNGGHDGTHHGKNGGHDKHHGGHDGTHNGKHHGKHDKHHGGPDTKGGKNKIVLDITELTRLTQVYDDASRDILQQRNAIDGIYAGLMTALSSMSTEPAVQQIVQGFEKVLGPTDGFASDARQHADTATYCDNIRRLAEEADTNHDGTWSRGEAIRFALAHQKDANDPAVAAVLAALRGGTIVRKAKQDADQGGKDANKNHPKNGPKDGGKNGGKDDKPGKHDGGNQPRPKLITEVIKLANKQHFVEQNGNNINPYGAWFGNNGSPWCADFVSWVFYHAGAPLPHIQGPKGYAYVPYAITYAKDHHQLESTPHAGDIFLLKDGSHTGIITHVNANGTFDTVEGNEGNQVSHEVRQTSGPYYYWRPIR